VVWQEIISINDNHVEPQMSCLWVGVLSLRGKHCVICPVGHKASVQASTVGRVRGGRCGGAQVMRSGHHPDHWGSGREKQMKRSGGGVVPAHAQGEPLGEGKGSRALGKVHVRETRGGE